MRMATGFLVVLGLMLAAGSAEASVKRDVKQLPLAEAHQSLSKGGPAIKLLIAPGGTMVGMLGGQGVAYRTDNLYLGGAGYGGLVASSGTIGGGFGYGGVVVGYDHPLAKDWHTDFSLLLGGGGGAAAVGSGGSLAIEPVVSLSRLFGARRATLGVGYLYLPMLNEFSGATVGLHFEFKSLTLTLPVED